MSIDLEAIDERVWLLDALPWRERRKLRRRDLIVAAQHATAERDAALDLAAALRRRLTCETGHIYTTGGGQPPSPHAPCKRCGRPYGSGEAQ